MKKIQQKKKTQQKKKELSLKVEPVQAGSEKQVPPWPKWFIGLFCLPFVGILVLLLGLVLNPSVLPGHAGQVFIIAILVAFGLWGVIALFYSLYRMFRYYTKITCWTVGFLAFICGVLFFFFWEDMTSFLVRVLFDWGLFVLIALAGVMLIQGVLALFWKPARKIGLFVFLLLFGMIYCFAGLGVDYYRVSHRPQIYERNADFKPIIYLYPTDNTEVSVRLGNPERLTHTYPPYEQGWRVVANPNGDLTEIGTGRKLYALYWEGINKKSPAMTEGFVVPGRGTIAFLEEKLPQLGLTAREAEEFIVYWLPILEENPYNQIRFLSLAEQAVNMPLEVEPRPDTVIRVMMAFQALIEPVVVTEQILPPRPERQGFTVVEWGGIRNGIIK